MAKKQKEKKARAVVKKPRRSVNKTPRGVNKTARAQHGPGDPGDLNAGDARFSPAAMQPRSLPVRRPVRQGPPARSTADPRFFWPQDKPMPGFVVKPRRGPRPCPECRRVLLDDSGRACVCTSSGSSEAWFRCRACGYRWCLPVKII